MKLPASVQKARARVHEIYAETQTLTRSRLGSNLGSKKAIDDRLIALTAERKKAEKVLQAFLDGRYLRIESGMDQEEVTAQNSKQTAMTILIDADKTLDAIATRRMDVWGEFRNLHRDAGMAAPARPAKPVIVGRGQRKTYGPSITI